MRCPNCSYKLVLLKFRSKYKCALCGKLYIQKEIESKEFQQWNKQQRESDLKLSNLNFIEERKDARKRWRQDNREFVNQYARDCRSKNKEQINTRRREAYSKNRKQIYEKYKQWQQKNQHNYNMKVRLAFLRQEQKQLALQLCKN